jgi:hypothetical protein
MALICNVQTQENHSTGGDWDELYSKNEGFIESGSAYFSQAFAETLGLVSDIELHNLEQAQLRLGSIRALLLHSLEQYRTSLDVDDRTGLANHHESTLRRELPDRRSIEQALSSGRANGYIAGNDEFIRRFSSEFHEEGYRALMNSYVDMVACIEALVNAGSTEPIVDWQGFTWQLTSGFSETMMFGQCIAVMNAVVYR